MASVQANHHVEQGMLSGTHDIGATVSKVLKEGAKKIQKFGQALLRKVSGCDSHVPRASRDNIGKKMLRSLFGYNDMGIKFHKGSDNIGKKMLRSLFGYNDMGIKFHKGSDNVGKKC